MKLKLISSYKPSGDQPQAIQLLINKIQNNEKDSILLGITGTGKTFTIANVIAKLNRPTIILSHNKTLATQLFIEFKTLFPNNRVEYFISNFDYYRPEAYLPSTDTYIDKTSKTNMDIEAMRMSTLNSLALGKPTIVIASVAAIYGQMNPKEYLKSFIPIAKGMILNRDDFVIKLIKNNYERVQLLTKPNTFRFNGDVIDILLSKVKKTILRIEMFDNEIEAIKEIDVLNHNVIKEHQSFTIYPGDSYIMREVIVKKAINSIRKELDERLLFFKSNNKLLEAQRLKEKTLQDIVSLEEFGKCPGIENYASHFDGRNSSQKPFTVLDFLVFNAKKNNCTPLMFIDESHMMIPQINAMYNGDRSRKEKLVEYGFRLPSALNNRPLKFLEFEKQYDFQRIYVSATPKEFELNKTGGEVVKQIIRPTGLVDPTIEIVSKVNQVEHLYNKILIEKQKKMRCLILTITKQMAEELTKFLQAKKIKIAYLHSDHKTFERDNIIRKLRMGIFDALVGINLIREGVDIPEISTVMILDADFESFFRSKQALIQIIGRAARNINGHVIMYANKITKSMQGAIDETNNNRKIQSLYNKKHHIQPKTIIKPILQPLENEQQQIITNLINKKKVRSSAAYWSYNKEQLKKTIAQIRGKMLQASRDMEYEKAIKLRDLIIELEIILDNQINK